jgi:ribokinase
VSGERGVRVAVIGHVEWVEFAQVERVPGPGEIANATRTWEAPAGGGGVAAVQLAALAGSATLYTALGDDELGHRAKLGLEDLGVTVRATFRPARQRRAFTYLDATGERTITTIGERLGPSGRDPLGWDELDATDGVYFTAGDDEALRAGRRAGVLVGTSRMLEQLRRVGLPLDAVVGSGSDASEGYPPGALDPSPGVVVRTDGRRGGTWERADGSTGRYPPAPVPGPVKDTYGCGDSFAAGLTFGLASGLEPERALEVAARCGARCLTRRGPYDGPLAP